mmetsp:Transcript_39508/g.156904  ORF Transcript_39508/g.156904 Transcript_39508/m.156904 type:complete len:227 (-) Transcript_39508:1453-2133(-)
MGVVGPKFPPEWVEAFSPTSPDPAEAAIDGSSFKTSLTSMRGLRELLRSTSVPSRSGSEAFALSCSSASCASPREALLSSTSDMVNLLLRDFVVSTGTVEASAFVDATAPVLFCTSSPAFSSALFGRGVDGELVNAAVTTLDGGFGVLALGEDGGIGAGVGGLLKLSVLDFVVVDSTPLRLSLLSSNRTFSASLPISKSQTNEFEPFDWDSLSPREPTLFPLRNSL